MIDTDSPDSSKPMVVTSGNTANVSFTTKSDEPGWCTPPEKPTKKIAIIGFTTTRMEAPWEDPDFELWICNNLYRFVPDHWDRLYDLHDGKDIVKDHDHEAYLRSTKKPVYVFETKPEWPTSVEFPKEAVTDHFGRYFTNSISWMIAHAILENATEIHVYGVDMAQGTEYAAQRPSCEYFLGLAVGLGIKVYVPPASDLLKNITMYGAESDDAFRAKLFARERDLTSRMGDLQSQYTEISGMLNQLQGALEDCRYWKGVWLNPHAERDGTPKMEDGQVPAAISIPETVASP